MTTVEVAPALPSRRTALGTALVTTVLFAVLSWLALRPGAARVQTGMAKWFNHPPQPLAFVMRVVNPLLRPIPLMLIALCLIVWLLGAARGRQWRLEIVRGLLISIVVTEVVAQGAKIFVDTSRPNGVIPGFDTHGYPGEPLGSGFPSAHAAVVVGLVLAVWPWLRRSQRIAGTLLAVLVCLHRLYIGAHWPLDVTGGIVIGVFSAAIVWLVAGRWPIRPKSPKDAPNAIAA